MERSLSNLIRKLVLVTGAGIGIGQGVALDVAREGAAVALHYAHSAQGGRAAAIGGDLSKVAECRRAVEAAAARFPCDVASCFGMCDYRGDARFIRLG
jgi:NAD(P)-dependent dehydrogenase (short-subunit alcohol dehydrogenase family)